MVFSSIVFLFLFLPVSLLLYHLTPARAKNLILLFISLVFYAWGEGKEVMILLLSVLINYCCGIAIDKGHRKLGLVLSVVLSLAILFYFKYLNFAFDNLHSALAFFGFDPNVLGNIPKIILPIGVSFFTFQTMSYTIDVYRGRVRVAYNFIDFAAFVSMFPHMVAGPIVRYENIAAQLKVKHISTDNFSVGVERFIAGLAKKILIANTLASVADHVFAMNISQLSTAYAWIGIVAYSFQIYFDFSAYSDMAIGLAKMLGFDLIENFNYPYISTSIREFWRRWHISLSTWFRDYVYVSLGGNQSGVARTYINLLIVFFITGLWHGASWNFVVWGLYHGAFLILERMGFDKILDSLWKPVRHFYTLIVVMVGWVFFRADSLSVATVYLGRMFAFTNGNDVMNSYLFYFDITTQTVTASIAAVIFSMPVYLKINQWLMNRDITYIRTALVFIAFLVSIMFLSGGSYNPFIYFRF